MEFESVQRELVSFQSYMLLPTEIATVRYRSRRYNARRLIPALYLVRKEVLVEHWAVTPHHLGRTMESVLDTEWFLHPEFAYPSGRLAAC